MQTNNVRWCLHVFWLSLDEAVKMASEPKEQFRDSSSLIIAAPIPKSKQQPGKANYKILLLQRGRMGTSAAAHVFPGKLASVVNA